MQSIFSEGLTDSVVEMVDCDFPSSWAKIQNAHAHSRFTARYAGGSFLFFIKIF